MNIKRWTTFAMAFFILGLIAAVVAVIAGIMIAKTSPARAMLVAVVGTLVTLICFYIAIRIVKFARSRYKKLQEEGKE